MRVCRISLTALEIAVSYLGVHEQGGNNTGPEVDQYLASVGLSPGYAWCAAFLYFCFRQAIQRRPINLAPGVDYFPPPNPCPRTGSALKLWKLSDMAWRDSNPAPGALYILDHGKGLGHAGIVETSDNTGVLTEISGNTNAAGSRARGTASTVIAALPRSPTAGRCWGSSTWTGRSRPRQQSPDAPYVLPVVLVAARVGPPMASRRHSVG